MHRRIDPPIAARPAPRSPKRPAPECIKSVRFCGQVGRGYNCARGAAGGIPLGGGGPGMPRWRVRRSVKALQLIVGTFFGGGAHPDGPKDDIPSRPRGAIRRIITNPGGARGKPSAFGQKLSAIESP